MSLLTELQARGVTAEDLEKAAAVRLFEKAAAAEGVDLDDLSEQQVIALFEQFTTPPSTEKEASAMNDNVIDLFEKTAAAEGIDLDEMSDEDLAELYQHYIENVLPSQIAEVNGVEKDASAQVVDLFQKTASAEGIDLESLTDDEVEALFEHYVDNVLPIQLGDAEATDKVADAQEKLAEAEILGRHMARAYMDEIQKHASEEEVEDVGADFRTTIEALHLIADNFDEEVLNDVLATKEASAAAGGGGVKQSVLDFLKKVKDQASEIGTRARDVSAAGGVRLGDDVVGAVTDAGNARRAAQSDIQAAAAQTVAGNRADLKAMREAVLGPEKKKGMSTKKKLAIGGGVAGGLGGLAALKHMSDKEASATGRAKELLRGSSGAGKAGKKIGLLSAATAKKGDVDRKVRSEARKILAARAGVAGAAGAAAGGGAYALKRRSERAKTASVDPVVQEAARLLALAGYEV